MSCPERVRLKKCTLSLTDTFSSSPTETYPPAARPECRGAPAHGRFRLGPESDCACSRPICARTAPPPAKRRPPGAKTSQENGKNCRLTSRSRSANIAPCLVRPKNQFSLTRAALSKGGRKNQISISSCLKSRRIERIELHDEFAF
jgi:hypothetical protein